MNKPERPKKRIPVVLKAAIWGAAVFVAPTIAVLVGDHFIGGHSGELWPDTIVGLLFLVFAPAVLIRHVLGLDSAPASSFVNSIVFGVLVNALLGAIFFAGIAAFWKFLTKVNHEQT